METLVMTDKDWRDTIEVGDRLITGSGLREVVRVNYRKNGRLSTLALPSSRTWHARGTTVYTRSDLSAIAFGVEKKQACQQPEYGA